MKSGLTLKFLIRATLACVVLTIVELLLRSTTSIHWVSPRDFKGMVA